MRGLRAQVSSLQLFGGEGHLWAVRAGCDYTGAASFPGSVFQSREGESAACSVQETFLNTFSECRGLHLSEKLQQPVLKRESPLLTFVI